MTPEPATGPSDTETRTSMVLYLGCAALLVAFLLADLVMPLGVAMGIPYVVAVLVTLWSPEKRLTIVVAAVSSLFVIMVFLYQPPQGELWKVILNRALALMAIWATAMLAVERKRIEDRREKAVRDREKALEEIKILRDLLPMCASCKKIRDDEGYWIQVDEYIRDNSEAEFTHGLCPECAKRLYPGFVIKDGTT